MSLLAESLKATAQRISQLPSQWRFGLPLRYAVGALAAIGLLWAGYNFTAQPVTLIINDHAYPVRTHRQTVGAVLQSLGVALEAEDAVAPPLDASLSANDTITIHLARPIILDVDHKVQTIFTRQERVDALLAGIGVSLDPRDDIYIDGKQVSPQSLLPATTLESTQQLTAGATPREAIIIARPDPIEFAVRRAVEVTLLDGQTRSVFFSAQDTIAKALQQHNITVYPEDIVTPNLDSHLSTGMTIKIDRAMPVTVQVDGRTVEMRTRQETVGAMLAQQGIALMGQDYTIPPFSTPISADDTIKVVRVREVIEITQQNIPFETKWIPDNSMELDRQEVQQPGANGIIKTRARVHYENGQEVWREIEDEWPAQEPQDHVIAYGTNIVVRALETDNGPVEYWRRISMLATAYSAGTSGKNPDHPRYGLTRTGMEAGYGVVAVDPKVIPLQTKLYVPGYGQAVAGDTGGGVIGKHVDLGYDENPPLMYEWRDVYVLTPVPPADQIRFVLPNWPQR